jgi:hypothetical protein
MAMDKPSKTERKALNKVYAAMRECHRRDFLVDEFDINKPREAQRRAFDIASKYGPATCDAIVMMRLGRAFQGLADVRERVEKERTNQAEEAR